jgi:hypothetical protein
MEQMQYASIRGKRLIAKRLPVASSVTLQVTLVGARGKQAFFFMKIKSRKVF